MSKLRIADAPLLPDVDGTEKIPTGGRGDYAISVDQIKDHIFQDVGKELVGLGNVDNTSDLDKPVSTAQQAALNLKADKTYVDTNLELKADKTNVYTRSETTLALSQKADLVNDVIPESQIPSSFNDVLEFTTANLPVIGESGKIYVTTDTNKTWRWASNRYVEISGWNPDSVSKVVTLPTYYTKEAGVHPVIGVADGAYFNVRSTDQGAILVEYQNIGGSAVATGRIYLSELGVQQQEKSAATIKDVSGKNQQQINDSIAVKFIKSGESGLVAWSTRKKPPYTNSEYVQAYNNGIVLGNLLKQYSDAGYSSVVLERANYPFCLSSERLNGSAMLDGLRNIDLDLNGSTLFMIFDSDNKNPYDTTSNTPYTMQGNMMRVQNTRYFRIKNGECVGDMYNRSFTNPAEAQGDGVHGIRQGTNNVGFDVVDVKFHGWKGDGIAGTSSGTTLHVIESWGKGGISNTGSEQVEDGAYRTAMLSLVGLSVIDNAIQLNCLRAAMFRHARLQVFFYTADNAYISRNFVEQSDNIILPLNCAKVRFVAYGDERTSDTVSYKNQYDIVLATGSPRFSKITRCEFYLNNRGGISNCPSETTIEDCKWEEIGTPKVFPHYSDATRYAVNIEDTYVGNIIIRGGSITNVPQGILANCASITIDNVKFRNQWFNSVTLYTTRRATLINLDCDTFGTNYATSSAIGFSSLSADFANFERRFKVANCTFKNGKAFYFDSTLVPATFIDIHDNTLDNCHVNIKAAKNVSFNSNKIFNPAALGAYIYYLKDLLSSKHNELVIQDNASLKTGQLYDNSGESNKAISLSTQNLNFTSDNAGDLHGYSLDAVGASSLYLSLPTAGVSPTFSNKQKGNKFFKTVTLYRETTTLPVASIVFDDCEFLSQTTCDVSGAASGNGNFDITYKNCFIDVTALTRFFYLTKQHNTNVSINFFGCTFYSDTVKSIPIIAAQNAAYLTNVTSQAVQCKFVNVTNIDGLIILS